MKISLDIQKKTCHSADYLHEKSKYKTGKECLKKIFIYTCTLSLHTNVATVFSSPWKKMFWASTCSLCELFLKSGGLLQTWGQYISRQKVIGSSNNQVGEKSWG